MTEKIKTSRFKNYQGIYYTMSLFLETNRTSIDDVVYTLKDEDHNGFPSLYRLYMETADPTEYSFAVAHLGGWRHWQMLTEANWFKPYVTRWREELEVKLRSKALSKIIAESKGSGRESFAAAKFLVDKGWMPKEEKKNPVGRPAKERIKEEALQEVRDMEEDLKRLQLQ